MTGRHCFFALDLSRKQSACGPHELGLRGAVVAEITLGYGSPPEDAVHPEPLRNGNVVPFARDRPISIQSSSQSGF
jgi:hypothetical protein